MSQNNSQVVGLGCININISLPKSIVFGFANRVRITLLPVKLVLQRILEKNGRNGWVQSRVESSMFSRHI